MPVNQHFSWTERTNTNEQTLAINLLEEAIQIYGMDVKYIPRTTPNLDTLLGEDSLSRFNSFHTVEMYFDNPMGYEGPNVMITKTLGFAISPTMNFVVSKRRFTQLTTMERPKEGDLIYNPLTKDFWEIKFANHEAVFFQLGQVVVWRLMVEKFVYSSERLDTGDSEIDGLEDALNHNLQIPNILPSDNDVTDSEADLEINFDEIDPRASGL